MSGNGRLSNSKPDAAPLKAATGSSGRGTRTQKERREATRAKLIDATVESLIEVGYARTSVKEICRRAGVSHGGLFGRFDSRVELIAASATEVGKRLIDEFARGYSENQRDEAPFPLFSTMMRTVSSLPINAVWHELLAAARTDPELRERLEPVIRTFYDQIRAGAATLPVATQFAPEDFELRMRLLLDAFNSEAIASHIVPDRTFQPDYVAFVTSAAGHREP